MTKTVFSVIANYGCIKINFFLLEEGNKVGVDMLFDTIGPFYSRKVINQICLRHPSIGLGNKLLRFFIYK